PEVIRIAYDEDSCAWLKSNQGTASEFPAATLPFSNDPTKETRTLPVENLRARLTYYSGDNVHEFKRVDIGCWLGRAGQSADLEVGGIVYLIAVILINGHGGFLENSGPPQRGDQNMSIDHLPHGRYELKVSL